MSGIPLIKRAYNLGLKAVPNFVEVLGETEISYYEQNLGQLQSAIRRGFVPPSQEVQQASVITFHKTADTDLFSLWVPRAEKLAKDYLVVDVDLRKRFAFPEEIPFRSAIPVFDPGGLTDRGGFEFLEKLGYDPWEETDVMQYSGSVANREPTLHLINNSIEPDADTMNLSPNQLMVMGRNWLGQRDYMLAFALHHFVTGGYMDPQTWTWFPVNRLPGGGVASGYWHPGFRGVGFGWSGPDSHDPHMGARLAVPVSLRP